MCMAKANKDLTDALMQQVMLNKDSSHEDSPTMSERASTTIAALQAELQAERDKNIALVKESDERLATSQLLEEGLSLLNKDLILAKENIQVLEDEIGTLRKEYEIVQSLYSASQAELRDLYASYENQTKEIGTLKIANISRLDCSYCHDNGSESNQVRVVIQVHFSLSSLF